MVGRVLLRRYWLIVFRKVSKIKYKVKDEKVVNIVVYVNLI